MGVTPSRSHEEGSSDFVVGPHIGRLT